ncbi:MAG TPA: glycosyltransferase [Candidatus Omnitrophota bacterium]|nr:glycosyltransferase [Candidatus Omnitrophota bacterium]
MPLFSVIIPTYNSARYISQTLRSVLSQTCRDFEIIVVDDGSTDATIDIVSGFEGIRVLKQSHAERAAARNKGIREASGTYISFLDADDLWLPHKLEADKKCFEGTGVDLVCSDVLVIDENGASYGKRRFNAHLKDIKNQVLLSNPFFTSTVSVTKSALEKSGLFCQEIKLSGSEDWEMWARLCQNGGVFHNPVYTVQYRQHKVLKNLAASIESSMLTAAEKIIALKPGLSGRFKNRIQANTHATIALNYAAAGNKEKTLYHCNRAFQFSWLTLFNRHIAVALCKVFTGIASAKQLHTGDGIVMVVTVYDGVGGLQTQCRLLSEHLQKMGFRVFIITRNYFNRPSQESNGLLFIRRFAFNPRHTILSSLYYVCASLHWLLLHQARYTVIHCFQLAAPLNIGALMKICSGKPLLVRLSGTGVLGDVKELHKLPLSRVRIFFMGFVDRFVVLNDLMKQELRGLLSVKQKEKVAFIPNGVPIDAESAFDEKTRSFYRKKLNLDFPILATYVGRLTVGKGLIDLLYAWKEIAGENQGAHLLLIGTGGMFKSIEPDLRALNCKLHLTRNVHFIGEVSIVREYLLASDIFILPTDSEGMSNALLEAMSCGLSIITTRIPSNTLLLDDSSARFIEPGHREQVTEALQETIKNPARSWQRAREAKIRAQEFSAEKIAGLYRTLYEEIV